ncbi:MAG TPA: cytochrome d ubiquinol oxidase subunit II [Phototrophicaceae bacterium]|nr:cytochrome d ubiquinol oxidase subunit II [Phototrophicaceae bacterium]
MDLQTLWFILIGILFTGFLFLEGFDFGVGILLPIVGKTADERKDVIHAIGPVWDGNEVWLLTAGGAMFAAFPNWYATLFSGFYLALFLILLGLIVRGISIEFRNKDTSPRLRDLWDAGIVVGSFLPALLWGVAFANILRGVAIDANMNYVGSFFDLLNPYALLGGVVTLTLFVLHGALFLELKTDGVIRERVVQVARVLSLPVLVIVLLFVAFSASQIDLFSRLNVFNVVGLIAAVAGLAVVGYAIWNRHYSLGFIGTSVTIIALALVIFATLFPRVLPSSLGSAYDLTIYNASSNTYSLQVMTVIALTLVPVVLLYQGWSYWIFRKRMIGAQTTHSELEY